MGKKSASGAGQKPNDPPAGPAATGETEPLASNRAPPEHGHSHPHIEFKFLEELKHRNVVRVALLYLVACWLVLEPTHVVFHMLEVPAWANRLVLVLMAIGLPAVAMFAWAFEITPEGLKPTLEVDPKKSIRTLTGRRLDRAIIVVLALALGYFVADKFWPSKRDAVAESVVPKALLAPSAPTGIVAPEKSIAVLPFVDMSEKKDREYFSDGLSEELIDRLAHIADLKVIARTSSFQFKGKNEDARTIGQRLGVANLLEGSVRTSGRSLRVTAQLINTADGSHRWSETYDWDIGDVFKMQDAIAAAVVTALQVKMAAVPTPPSSKEENTEAYNAFLRGKYFYNRQTKEDTERAIVAFKDATRLDPGYALAWNELALAYNARGRYGWVPPRLAYAEARKALDQALKLDPNLPSAHYALAAIEWNYNFDFAASRAEKKRGLELDPTNPVADFGEGIEAMAAGHIDGAIRAFEKSLDADPLNGHYRFLLVQALFDADRLNDAEAAVRNLLELNGSIARAHCLLGEILLAKRQYSAALSAMNEEPDEISRLSCLPDALWATNRRDEAETMLLTLKTKYSAGAAAGIAEIYAQRNDRDAAFEWLNRAYENRQPWIAMMRSDRLLRNLVGDPRYDALLRRMKLLD